MDEWLTKISGWFVDLVKSIFSTIVDLISDVVVWVLDLILGPIGDLITSLGTPSFMASYSFGSLLSGLPPFALYIVNQCNLPAALAVIGAGVSFNLLRKLFTLGQW